MATKSTDAIADLHPQFLVDDLKNPTAVLLPISEWRRLIEYLEDIEDIRACINEESNPSERIPFDQAVQDIRAAWKK